MSNSGDKEPVLAFRLAWLEAPLLANSHDSNETLRDAGRHRWFCASALGCLQQAAWGSAQCLGF